MPDPLLDTSTPCCFGASRLPKTQSGQCDLAATLLPGGTGGVSKPTTSTWTNSLNATSGSGGGSSFTVADPDAPSDWQT